MRNLILSALFFASAFQTAKGQTYTSGDFQYTLSNGQATIVSASVGGAVTIPSSLNYYPVVSIGDGAFQSSPSIFSVIISDGVTSIGRHAFQGCLVLSIVIIPDSVTSIGSYAFANCISLFPVTIPKSVTSIGSYAFANCTILSSVTIPNSVTSIGSQAFDGCTYPVTVYLPARFETTYQDFGLTASQVYFYGSSSTSYLAGQQSVIANPNTYSLYTATQYNDNFNTGRQSILTNPNASQLYTTSQIQNMAVGDLVLTKNGGGTFTLNYDIEQSADLQTWTTYAPLSLPLTGLPTDKAFVRIKAK